MSKTFASTGPPMCGPTSFIQAVEAADYVTARRNASPQAKWLVNELAVLRGKAELIRERIRSLKAREDELLEKIDALELVASTVTLPVDADPPVRIRGWERYGTRGSLNAMLLNTLEEFHPQSVSTTELVARVLTFSGFTHDLETRGRDDVRQSVVRRLRHLRDDGKIERTGQLGEKKNSAGLWRVMKRSDVTLQSLQAQTAAALDAEAF